MLIDINAMVSRAKASKSKKTTTKARSKPTTKARSKPTTKAKPRKR